MFQARVRQAVTSAGPLRARSVRRAGGPARTTPLILGFAAVLGGCSGGGGEKPPASLAAEGREVLSGPPTASWSVNSATELEPLSRAEAPEASREWTIVLVAYRGENQAANARRAVEKVRTEAGLEGVRAERRGDATVVAYGSYEDPEDPRAQADLKRIQEMEVGGGTPFSLAVLSPPPDSAEGSLPQFDLRNVTESFGPDALYTLQVAIYTRNDDERPSRQELEEFRRKAEQAVLQLRAEGEKAFYYHGPFSSTVTIGVFGPDDFEEDGNPFTPPKQSERLKAARERHPYNLVNGQGVRDKGPDGKERMQPSGLVAIPD